MPPKLARSAQLMLLAAAIGACGGDDKAAPATSKSPETAGRECGSVKVTGHQAVQIMASGTSCDSAKEVAAAAEGRGRAAYEASGFSCKPSGAGGGDTNYACTGAGGRITFLYGTT